MAEAVTTTAPRERPILFSTALVRAILEGKKNVTRRLVKPPPPSVEAVIAKCGIDFSIFTDHHSAPNDFRVGGPVWAVREMMKREPRWRSPYGAPGDRLWVREAWIEGFPTGKRGQWTCLRPSDFRDTHGRAFYRADGEDPPNEAQRPWRPSIHMPRWASRITLEVTGVRVERLHEITSEDVAAEGIRCRTHEKCAIGCAGRRYAFYDKWDELHGEGAAAKNPWVWVVAFRRLAR